MATILELIPSEKFTKTEIKIIEKLFEGEEKLKIYSYFLTKYNDLTIKLKNKNDLLSDRIIKLNEKIIINKKENKESYQILFSNYKNLNQQVLDINQKIENMNQKINSNNYLVNYDYKLICGNSFLIVICYILCIVLYLMINPINYFYKLYDFI